MKADEILGAILLSWHNIHYYQSLMAAMRAAIANHNFETFARQFAHEQALGDIAPL